MSASLVGSEMCIRDRAVAATQVEDCPNAVSAEARAAALAVELLLQAAIPGPRITIAGDCRPVVNYAAGCGRLRRADQHHLLDSALARLVGGPSPAH
eukprot:3349331-Alexandrium_andersonii.AAC.1